MDFPDNFGLDLSGLNGQDGSVACKGTFGEMAERLKAPVSKTGSCASATRVRIPISPRNSERRRKWLLGNWLRRRFVLSLCRQPGPRQSDALIFTLAMTWRAESVSPWPEGPSGHWQWPHAHRRRFVTPAFALSRHAQYKSPHYDYTRFSYRFEGLLRRAHFPKPPGLPALQRRRTRRR